MINVVIWGAGNNCKLVLDAIRKDKCNIIGIVDSNKMLSHKLYSENLMIYAPEELINDKVDYIVISVYFSDEILLQCRELGISEIGRASCRERV